MSRFSEPQHPDFQRLNASIAFDNRLWPEDVAQSRAHVHMLAARAIVSAADADALLAGLEAVERELAGGQFAFRDDDEDIHMAIERRLTEIAGPVGGRLHTARSRNDQVATDVALYTRARAADARTRLRELMGAILARAEEHIDWPMPGYTHLQRAQPVYLSHHLLAYLWMLDRDRARFAFTEDQAGVLPLGAGALAGVNFDTDRALVADELGFHTVAPNSVDAVSNRDFVIDYLAAAATCTTHLSRLGAELVLWSSEEFGFCELPDAWASGSSIMPQKKNPDAAELLRAKAPRTAGHLVGFLGVLHAPAPHLQQGPAGGQGAPLRRRRHARARARRGPGHARGRALPGRSPQRRCLGRDARRHRRGRPAGPPRRPFRDAHGVVAGLVRTAVDSGRPLSALTREELAAHSDALDDEYYEVLVQRSWLESKVSEGGTSLARVRQQIERARAAIEDAP